MKICRICKNDKSIDQFYRRSGKGSYRSECKQCLSEESAKKYTNHKNQIRSQQNKKYSENPEYFRNHRLKSVFGISIDEYSHILKNQNGACAICKSKEVENHQKGKIKNLTVDHSHKTGKVRGLLCGKCNRAIGLLNEDIGVIKNAIKYLRKEV